jgi:dipeptidyl aminopeptidase/acylaminoacyl peptidase
MKKIIVFLLLATIVAVFVGMKYFEDGQIFTPLGKGKIMGEKKLASYTHTALKMTEFPGSKIRIDKQLKDEENFSSYIYYFDVRGKKVSGLMNIPKNPGNYPAIVMIRGYVDTEIYSPGTGTSHGGEYLAQNGFITLAPDFLGYGFSDKGSDDAMEDRFLTYVTAIEQISSIKNLNQALVEKSLDARYDDRHLGLWGHSNGGQIALSVLEITGKEYPTVLWAPVSKPFPYSILFYTDQAEDRGKSLRKLLADFEKDYDVDKYSVTNYLDWIKAPVMINQGGLDEDVPQKWSVALFETLKDKKKEVEYFTYPKESHNFDQGEWPLVMERTTGFYQTKFK